MLALLAGCLVSVSGAISLPASDQVVISGADTAGMRSGSPGSTEIDALNLKLVSFLTSGNIEGCGPVVRKLQQVLKEKGGYENESRVTSVYLIGVYFLKKEDFNNAVLNLELASSMKESKNQYDGKYAKIMYNLAIAYNGIGDFNNQMRCANNSIRITRQTLGDKDPALLDMYLSVMIASLGLHEYEDALEYSKQALEIAAQHPEAIDPASLAATYMNRGVLYIHMADYSKARVNFEKTESLYLDNKFSLDESYLILWNNMAITYGFLGMFGKSTEYFEKGISLAESTNSYSGYNYVNSYALALARSGNIKKGELLLEQAVKRAGAKLSADSPVYFTVLQYYAEYLRDEMNENSRALGYYRKCIDYIGKNRHNILLQEPVYLGYAMSLSETGDISTALRIIQSLLFPEIKDEKDLDRITMSLANPDFTRIKPDKLSLRIIHSKYQMLHKEYMLSHDREMLEKSASTARLLVQVLEKVRMNISEEDSRLILGDRYRDAYVDAIRDYSLLYSLAGDPSDLESAYEFAEKSKVAGLLASVRELNASQFNVPPGLGDLESRLRRDISFFSSTIDDEMKKEHPDTTVIASLNERLLKSTMLRDSLVKVFEKDYPGYYSFKYNTSVARLSDLPGLIGRDVNYISYVASDSLLFIFIANRKTRHILSFKPDSTFYSDIKEFRNLLGMPSPDGNARESFEKFKSTGYRLYSKILLPVMPYLISDKLLISPDNMLSYIPFETIPTSPDSGSALRYSQLSYLMNRFDISYTYSVTYLAESLRRKSGFTNRLIAFAPDYSEPVDIGTVLQNRQITGGVLPDLPYARQEAEYVAALTGGALYEGPGAKEAVFKSESGKFDIIHLAMHTILDDRNPMNSTLIFSAVPDTSSDRYLKTHEIYSIPLRAKMVVLSSCNSGTGLLYSGEGIMSLARGFLYSGSGSVVMAMWEIEDRSGTEIVKSFYENLRKGYSKSSSLRKARIKYLEEADQLRSHPYFWSTLVVYGDNRPLYISKLYLMAGGGLALLAVLIYLVYRRKRRYS